MTHFQQTSIRRYARIFNANKQFLGFRRSPGWQFPVLWREPDEVAKPSRFAMQDENGQATLAFNLSQKSSC